MLFCCLWFFWGRLSVTRQLGLLQRDRPWTAMTVKTRQAVSCTLNVMLLDAGQLKEEGRYYHFHHPVIAYLLLLVVSSGKAGYFFLMVETRHLLGTQGFKPSCDLMETL